MKIAYAILIVGLMILSACDKQTTPAPQPAAPAASCADSIQNQGESDIDCGGPCTECVIGKACANDADCLSEYCNEQNLCQVTSCYDGKWNGRETAVDCGGPCPACETCDDGVKNQDEIEADCGGKCKACSTEPYVLADADREVLKTQLKLNTKAMFLSNSYSGLDVGKTHIFALGITNTYLKDETFTVLLSFDKARDSMNNGIDGLDPVTVMTWLGRNQFSGTTLAKYGQAFLPVGITVGREIAPNVKTVPGTYYFNADVLYQAAINDYDPYITLPFSVIVK